jgi:hypothetical protein
MDEGEEMREEGGRITLKYFTSSGRAAATLSKRVFFITRDIWFRESVKDEIAAPSPAANGSQ